MKCSECANLIRTPLGLRCRYEWDLLSNPRGGACARGERFVQKEARE
jgi:hypothetical protein